MLNRFINLTVKTVTTYDTFYSLREEWNSLLESSEADNFFLRWEWLFTWWQQYKVEKYQLCILLVYKEEMLVGIGPFYFSRWFASGIIPLRMLMFLGTSMDALVSEYMDIISIKGHEEDVLNAIFQHIKFNDIADDINFQKIPILSRTPTRLKELAHSTNLIFQLNGTYECPYIALPKSWDLFLAGLSSSMRAKIRNSRRKLLRYKNVVIRSTMDAGEFDVDFSEFVRLHQKRWESRSMPGSFSSGRFTGFLNAVMKEMLKNGHLSLNFLAVSGKNIASLCNIIYKDRVYFFQAGLDTSFDRYLTPGILLHAHCIEDAIKRGRKEYDFLLMGKMDEYKKRWTTESRALLDINIQRPIVIRRVLSIKGVVTSTIKRYLYGREITK